MVEVTRRLGASRTVNGQPQLHATLLHRWKSYIDFTHTCLVLALFCSGTNATLEY